MAENAKFPFRFEPTLSHYIFVDIVIYIDTLAAILRDYMINISNNGTMYCALIDSPGYGAHINFTQMSIEMNNLLYCINPVGDVAVISDL